MFPMVFFTIENSDDADMIIQLYTNYYGLFFKTAHDITKDSTIITDIINEAFTRTICYMDRVRAMPYHCQVSYVNKIVRNLSLEAIKDKKICQYIEDTPMDFPDDGTDVMAVDGYIALKDAIKQLSPIEQDLLCLNYLGYQEKEITDLIGVKHVRQYIHRARKKIKKLLEEGEVTANGKK